MRVFCGNKMDQWVNPENVAKHHDMIIKIKNAAPSSGFWIWTLAQILPERITCKKIIIYDKDKQGCTTYTNEYLNP